MADRTTTRGDKFAWRLSVIYLSSTALYALYALQVLDNFAESVSMPRRLMMTAGSASVALALLVPVATFSAALRGFDLFDETEPGKRRRDWIVLFVAGLGSYLSSAIGPLASAAGTSLAERPVSGVAAMLLLPLALGVFSVVAGIVGALVGDRTKWMIAWRRQVARWTACCVLLVLFCVAVVVVDALIARRGWGAAWLFVVAPPAMPVAAAWIMLRRQGHHVRDMLPVPSVGTRRRPLGPGAVDRLVAIVAREPHGGAAAPAFESEAEADMAAFLGGFRRVALPDVAVSDVQVEKIVDSVVATAPGSSTAPITASRAFVVQRRRFDVAAAGELGVSWAGIVAGLLLVGAVGGLVPNVGAAAGVGLLGSLASAWMARRPTAPSPTSPDGNWLPSP